MPLLTKMTILALFCECDSQSEIKNSSILARCLLSHSTQLFSATFYHRLFFVIRYSLFVWRVIFYGLKGSFLSSFIPPYFKWFENPSSSSENVLASFVKLIVCLLLAQVIAQELEKGSEKKSSQVFFLPPAREKLFSFVILW